MEGNRDNLIDLDLAILHPITVADRHVRMCPYADAARDGTMPHRISEILRELHVLSLAERVQA